MLFREEKMEIKEIITEFEHILEMLHDAEKKLIEVRAVAFKVQQQLNLDDLTVRITADLIKRQTNENM